MKNGVEECALISCGALPIPSMREIDRGFVVDVDGRW